MSYSIELRARDGGVSIVGTTGSVPDGGFLVSGHADSTYHSVSVSQQIGDLHRPLTASASMPAPAAASDAPGSTANEGENAAQTAAVDTQASATSEESDPF